MRYFNYKVLYNISVRVTFYVYLLLYLKHTKWNHRIPWAGRDLKGSSSSTPGTTQGDSKLKPYVWECCWDAPWATVVWCHNHCLGEPVSCSPPLVKNLFQTPHLHTSPMNNRYPPCTLYTLNFGEKKENLTRNTKTGNTFKMSLYQFIALQKPTMAFIMQQLSLFANWNDLPDDHHKKPTLKIQSVCKPHSDSSSHAFKYYLHILKFIYTSIINAF